MSVLRLSTLAAAIAWGEPFAFEDDEDDERQVADGAACTTGQHE